MKAWPWLRLWSCHGWPFWWCTLSINFWPRNAWNLSCTMILKNHPSHLARRSLKTPSPIYKSSNSILPARWFELWLQCISNDQHRHQTKHFNCLMGVSENWNSGRQKSRGADRRMTRVLLQSAMRESFFIPHTACSIYRLSLFSYLPLRIVIIAAAFIHLVVHDAWDNYACA